MHLGYRVENLASGERERDRVKVDEMRNVEQSGMVGDKDEKPRR